MQSILVGGTRIKSQFWRIYAVFSILGLYMAFVREGGKPSGNTAYISEIYLISPEDGLPHNRKKERPNATGTM